MKALRDAGSRPAPLYHNHPPPPHPRPRSQNLLYFDLATLTQVEGRKGIKPVSIVSIGHLPPETYLPDMECD